MRKPECLSEITQNTAEKFLQDFDGKPEAFYSSLGAERQEGRLENGLNVVLFKRPGASINIQLATLGGARFDPVEQQGRAHFNEHMTLSGTKEYPQPAQLTEIIQGQAGYINAYTSLELMWIVTALNTPSDLERAMWTFYQVMNESLYDSDMLDTERKAILQELGNYEMDPESFLDTVYQKAFFSGTPLEMPIGGTKESVSQITKEHLMQHSEEMFVGDRMTLIAAGNIDFDLLMAQANEAIGVLPRGNKVYEKGSLPENRENEGIVIHRYPGIDKVAFHLGFRTDHFKHPDVYPLGVLADILGGGSDSSLLMKKLRYEKGTGYVYGAWVKNYSYNDTGTFGVMATTTKEHLQKVFDITTGLIKDIRGKGISADKIEDTKNKLIKASMGTGLETSDSWVGAHLMNEVAALHPHPDASLQDYKFPVYNFAKGVSGVTSDDIQRVANKYFQDGKWYLAVCGDITKDDFKIDL